MIELWRHIRNNYNSNRDFARKNGLSINTVQNAIARNKHIVDEKKWKGLYKKLMGDKKK